MQSTQQRVYAANLQQNLGYPLRSPRPKIGLSSPYADEGYQIGDVGHVDQYGEFRLLFNIKFAPVELSLDPPGDPHFDRPVPRQGCDRETLFVSGANRSLSPGESRKIQGYKFLATSDTGAILILPDGATLFELEDKHFDDIQQLATKHAVQWCRYAGRDSLYLLTAVYKTRAWTLGAFSDGFRGGEIYVDRQPDTGAYKWECAFTMDHQQAPQNNPDLNQTVFIKGFKVTVRRDLLLAIERLEKPERWFSRLLAKLQLKARKLLSGPKIEYFPALNFSQPSHPLDIVNHFLLDKVCTLIEGDIIVLVHGIDHFVIFVQNPGVQMAITHDNDWIEMLEKGLPPADLMEDGPLRNFMQKRYVYGLDSEQSTVYLRRNSSRESSTVCEREPTPDRGEETNNECKLDDGPETPCGDSRLVITNMRLESFDVDHVDAGVCVLVQFGSTMRRTVNKPYASIIEWDDEIMLPSDLPVYVTVCGIFQLGSTLGTREISAKQTINTGDLSGSTYKKRFFFGDSESRSSLLVTLERHFSYCETHFSYDEKSVFIEKTALGFDAFYSHHRDRQKESLETALGHFRDALAQCNPDHAHHATACFNLGTSEFIRSQGNGTYSELTTSIGLYREALGSRGDGHPDRPATLLLLAQALLSRHGQEYDESVTEEIGQLLAELHHDDSRNRRTADAVIATCRFYKAISSQDPAEVDGLLRDLDHGIYEPPYGYFDRPRLVHRLGAAFWRRFQSSANLDDLDKSIELNAEAVQVPHGHDDRMSIVACLGNSLLCALEARGELTDLDMTGGLTELGKQVVAKLDDATSSSEQIEAYSEVLREQMDRMAAAEHLRERVELMSAVETLRERIELMSAPEKLREQIELMFAADDALQAIIEQGPSPRNPEVQRHIDEWSEEEGSPIECRRRLGVLLSFLGGEGEVKMCKVLEQLDFEWPYKDHKIAGTTRALQGYMPYFYSVLASRLRCLMEGWA